MAHAYRTSARVEAPAALVWQVLSDVERMPAWTTSMRRVTILGAETTIAVGSQVEIEQPGLPPATWVVDGLTDGHGFSWSTSTPGVRTAVAHLITPLPGARDPRGVPERDGDASRGGGDACEVAVAVAQSGMLAGLTGQMTGTRSRELVDVELASLKAESESRAADKA